MGILEGELRRQFDITKVYGRVALAGGRPVKLDDRKGVVFQLSKEAEALSRWRARQFLEVERNIAKRWRRSLTQIDLDAMVKTVIGALGPWRSPKTLQDAKTIADAIIDYLDPEWLLRFGLDLLGLPEETWLVVEDWIAHRRPPLREHVPYFVFMLTVNVFFCLVLPTRLLRDVKPSHQVDLAYLYYLPFCSAFTSKDNFHAQIVPLFLDPNQIFVNGIDFKEDMKRLNEHYSALPDEILRTGLSNFAIYPPEDTSFLTTTLWDKYLPGWRKLKASPKPPRDPAMDEALIQEIERCDSPDSRPRDGEDIDELDYVKLERSVCVRKGKWRRFSQDVEQRMRERGELH
jgi:hypothetical protein